MNDKDITSVSRSDFTNDYSIWRVKWHVGNISNLTVLKSEYFWTTIQQDVDIIWQLSVRREDGSVFLCLALPECTEKPVTTIYRFGWCNGIVNTSNRWRMGGSNIHFSDARCFAVTDDYQYSPCIKLPPNEPVDDITFHCWIIIPKYNGDSEICGTSFRWDSDRKLSSDLADLFDGVLDTNDQQKSLSDVTLAIVDPENGNVERQFYCHRNILISRSSMFKRMFAEQWQESKDKIIGIKDIGGNAMENILRYMYTGELPPNDLDFDEIKNIVNAAEKYDLPHMKTWCVANFILRTEKDLDRIDQLQFADRYGLDQLKAVCLASLSINMDQFEDEEMRRRISTGMLLELYKLAEKNKRNANERDLETSTR